MHGGLLDVVQLGAVHGSAAVQDNDEIRRGDIHSKLYGLFGVYAVECLYRRAAAFRSKAGESLGVFAFINSRLGQKLGCGAYLLELKRERIGRFALAGAVTLEQLALPTGFVPAGVYTFSIAAETPQFKQNLKGAFK